MKFAKSIALLAISAVTLFMPACASAPQRETVMQVSTIDALMNGVYDGMMTIGELKDYGDFGIGTFEALDGEMLVLDGVVYQVKADGIAYTVDNSAETPFAAVTRFDSDYHAELSDHLNYT